MSFLSFVELLYFLSHETYVDAVLLSNIEDHGFPNQQYSLSAFLRLSCPFRNPISEAIKWEGHGLDIADLACSTPILPMCLLDLTLTKLDIPLLSVSDQAL